MSQESKDLFVVSIFSLIWIVRPIFYDKILSGADPFPPLFPQRYEGRTTNGMGGSSTGSNSAPT